jgi:hypothetical protein
MVILLEFIKYCSKLYFGYEHRDEGFYFIKTHILWFQPFLVLLFFSTWYFLLTAHKINILTVIGSIILFTLSSFLAVTSTHFSMKILGGIGTLKDMYKFGLSIWLFPTILNIIFYMITLLFQSKLLSFILGILLALVGVYTILIAIVVYSKLQNLSTEYTFLGLFIPFLIMSLIIYLINLAL